MINTSKIQDIAKKINKSENDVIDVLNDYLNEWFLFENIEQDLSSMTSPEILKKINKDIFGFLSSIKKTIFPQQSNENRTNIKLEEISVFLKSIPTTISKEFDDAKCDFKNKLEQVGLQSNVHTKEIFLTNEEKMKQIIGQNTKEILTINEDKMKTIIEKSELTLENKLLNHTIKNNDKINDNMTLLTEQTKTLSKEIQQSNSTNNLNFNTITAFFGSNNGKKEIGEHYIENSILKKLPADIKFNKTSHMPNQTDYQLQTKDGITISLEVKNWNCNVDRSETKKTREILASSNNIDVCIMVCLKESIESHHEVYFENVGGNKMLWFYPYALNSDAEYLYPLILMSRSIASMIKQKIRGKEGDDNKKNNNNKKREMINHLITDILGALKLLHNLNSMNLCQDDLNRIIKKQAIQINQQKSIVNDVITKLELSIENIKQNWEDYFGVDEPRSELYDSQKIIEPNLTSSSSSSSSFSEQTICPKGKNKSNKPISISLDDECDFDFLSGSNPKKHKKSPQIHRQ